MIVKIQILKIDVTKSHGIEEIGTKLLKIFHLIAQNFFTRLLNCCSYKCYFPDIHTQVKFLFNPYQARMSYSYICSWDLYRVSQWIIYCTKVGLDLVDLVLKTLRGHVGGGGSQYSRIFPSRVSPPPWVTLSLALYRWTRSSHVFLSSYFHL